MNKIGQLRFDYYVWKNRAKWDQFFPHLGNWSLVKNLECYTSNIPYEYCQDLDINPKYIPSSKILFHTFWNGEVSDKILFSIKSFLATQHSYQYELWIWFDGAEWYNKALGSSKISEITSKFPQVKIKMFDIMDEIIGTPFERMKWFFSANKPLCFKGDDFRIIVLYKWGGGYFDLDIMFLRDIGGLLSKDFTYAWERQAYANSALLYIVKSKNEIISKIVHKAIRIKSTQPWSLFQYKDKSFSNLQLYPAYIFDPLWKCCSNPPYNEFGDFFRKFDSSFNQDQRIKSYKDFFPNAYAYHWHNHWSDTIYHDSYFGIFNLEVTQELNLTE